MSLMSRGGNIIQAPAFITALLPLDIILDGKLWLGRQQFQQGIGITRSVLTETVCDGLL